MIRRALALVALATVLAAGAGQADSPLHSISRAGVLELVYGTTPGLAEECPRTELLFGCDAGNVDLFRSAPDGSAIGMGDSTIASWQSGQNCPIACYDLPHGRLGATADQQGTSACYNAVGLQDSFRLVGAPGPSVPFEVALLVECAITDSGSATAALIAEPPAQSPVANFFASGSAEVVLPLIIVPNATFRVYSAVVARTLRVPDLTLARGSAHITGDLRFRGIPPGYALVSCNGYDLPVPAVLSSWGRIKALYR